MLAVIVLSAVALSLYVAPVLPVVVALVTKATAPAWLKGVLLTVLSGVTALVGPAVQNGADITVDGPFLGQFVVVNVVALAVYFGLLKPAGIPAAVAAKVPGGIG